VYDASECPGAYYESEAYEKDPPYECAYDPVAGPNTYAGEAGVSGKWHVLMRGSYVLKIASWGFQDIWIEFEVGKGEGGELLYIDDESWWMEWGWKRLKSQITLPAVSSIDGKVSKGDVFYRTFLADEAGSFEFVNAPVLASTKWTKYHPGPKYLELDAGSYVIYFKCAGYMYSWTYLDVWWSTNVVLPSVLFVPTLQAGQVQFVMQWRYRCMDDDGLMDYEMCPKQVCSSSHDMYPSPHMTWTMKCVPNSTPMLPASTTSPPHGAANGAPRRWTPLLFRRRLTGI
jgi:hypothetical protein